MAQVRGFTKFSKCCHSIVRRFPGFQQTPEVLASLPRKGGCPKTLFPVPSFVAKLEVPQKSGNGAATFQGPHKVLDLPEFLCWFRLLCLNLDLPATSCCLAAADRSLAETSGCCQITERSPITSSTRQGFIADGYPPRAEAIQYVSAESFRLVGLQIEYGASQRADAATLI